MLERNLPVFPQGDFSLPLCPGGNSIIPRGRGGGEGGGERVVNKRRDHFINIFRANEKKASRVKDMCALYMVDQSKTVKNSRYFIQICTHLVLVVTAMLYRHVFTLISADKFVRM